ncbi:hypothetical protein BCR37DRAFT_393538 [Protomyces lactucae-debilis]|uniref:Uncharacterized protein n=1 Tax=Protomyces lactucae-debilis TaxID=2754530 RepID=A0A1Y2FAE3_PROLT|nr:uncharacterized protein BCR37DRAFT_393538 [Protomyces lactucae-debilis]ORY80892.1 hypothetical protein BCR37DRAFT_393538 [Protomyces lactucae-debilis]
MGSQHKRHEGLKTFRRTAAKPKIEKKQAPVELTPLQQAHRTLSQELLNALATLVAPQLEDMETFTAQLQQIKQHFFKRNYELVFQNSELCDVYAARYLPSRALAYADLFHSTKPVLDLLYPPPRAMRPSERRLQPAVQKREPVRITAVGAGVGSELCALQLLPRLRLAELDVDVDEDLIEVLDRDIEMDVIDNAAYAPFLSTLETSMADAFPPPKAKLGQCTLRYHQEDILQYGTTDAFAAMLSETTLLTFMFVFNELFAASRVDAMKLIEAIAKNLPAGAHVLLIESAGDLSEVQVADGTMMAGQGLEVPT